MLTNHSAREEVEGSPPRIHSAKSVEEAVRMARRFVQEGTYDLFRGQLSDWPPHSSLYRRFAAIDKTGHDEAILRRDWLWDWMSRTPQLAYALDSEKAYQFLAIAQHYHIPTNLIDFTTDPEVAAFFAGDGDPPPEGRYSCIYCLDSRSIEKVWAHASKTRNRTGMRLETVRVDVKNLWRLDAQRGVFIHANYAWDIDYPLDRILFPYSGNPPASSRTRIYPSDKSELEILLDQYFAWEVHARITHTVAQAAQAGMVKSVNFISTDLPDFDHEVFNGGAKPARLDSWGIEKLDGWHATVSEPYFDTVGGDVRVLDLRDLASPASASLRVRAEFERILHAESGLRLKAVSWQADGLPDYMGVESLEKPLRMMWNGMRRLPYTDEEIAECAASVVLLMASGFHGKSSEETKKNAFKDCFGEPYLVSMTNMDGSDAHAYASRAALLSGLQPGLKMFLGKPLRGFFPDSLNNLFWILKDPRFMFEFPFLRERFVREVIPTQVAVERSTVLFNPAKLASFW